MSEQQEIGQQEIGRAVPNLSPPAPLSELMTALAAAQAEMSNAPFNQTNSHFKNKYADLASIRDATIPHLAKHGLSIHQVTQMWDQGMFLVTRLGHVSGSWLESVYPLPNSSKPHEMGSAITYARRYSWAAITGIAAEEDEDGNAAQDAAKNGAPASPFFPKRKSSAQAKRDGDWPTLERALLDTQSAREVERLREEWRRDWYPLWKQDWRDAAEEEFDKRMALFSASDLKQTLKDSLDEQPAAYVKATSEQIAKFKELVEWLDGAHDAAELKHRATNDGYLNGFKLLTRQQQDTLREHYTMRLETLRGAMRAELSKPPEAVQ